MRRSDGFSLIEATIATALLAGALMTLAQLVNGTIRANVVARDRTIAAVLASQKVDEIRSTPGIPIGGVDYIDRWGAVIGQGGSAPQGTAFVRGWTIQSMPGSTLGTRILHIQVAHVARISESTRVTAAVRPR